MRDTPIIVLDEPWSNLDADARQVLAEVINEFRPTTTVLILTHEDLDSLQVDRVYNLAPGSGTFALEGGSRRDVVSLAGRSRLSSRGHDAVAQMISKNGEALEDLETWW